MPARSRISVGKCGRHSSRPDQPLRTVPHLSWAERHFACRRVRPRRHCYEPKIWLRDEFERVPGRRRVVARLLPRRRVGVRSASWASIRERRSTYPAGAKAACLAGPYSDHQSQLTNHYRLGTVFWASSASHEVSLASQNQADPWRNWGNSKCRFAISPSFGCCWELPSPLRHQWRPRHLRQPRTIQHIRDNPVWRVTEMGPSAGRSPFPE